FQDELGVSQIVGADSRDSSRLVISDRTEYALANHLGDAIAPLRFLSAMVIRPNDLGGVSALNLARQTEQIVRLLRGDLYDVINRLVADVLVVRLHMDGSKRPTIPADISHDRCCDLARRAINSLRRRNDRDVDSVGFMLHRRMAFDVRSQSI